MKKEMKLREIIFPSKKINFFIVTILILGVLSGSIFLMLSSDVDKANVVKQIETFFQNVSIGAIPNGMALKNSLIINYIFLFLIWTLGLSMIGIIVNIFLIYIKGFLVGFSVASIFLTFGYKGILGALLYTFPSQVLNVIVVMILGIYSIMFAKGLFTVIFSKKTTKPRIILKRYLVILMFCVIVSFISSVLEVYLFPNILKLVISFYV